MYFSPASAALALVGLIAPFMVVVSLMATIASLLLARGAAGLITVVRRVVGAFPAAWAVDKVLVGARSAIRSPDRADGGTKTLDNKVLLGRLDGLLLLVMLDEEAVDVPVACVLPVPLAIEDAPRCSPEKQTIAVLAAGVSHEVEDRTHVRG
jgi:hypothetical protein